MVARDRPVSGHLRTGGDAVVVSGLRKSKDVAVRMLDVHLAHTPWLALRWLEHNYLLALAHSVECVHVVNPDG